MSYIVGHPIKRPSDFYGRSSQVARFYEIIGGTQAQSASVLGVRRAGKTSFLQYVAHRSTKAKYLRDPDNYTMIYINMSTCKKPADFYYGLLRRLQYALGVAETGFLWKESPPNATSMYDVEAFLCQFPERRIILLLDEFDQIRVDTFSQEFLTELRAMTSVLDYDLAFVTASYWDLYYLGTQIGLPPTSPFYNIFYPTPIYIPGLEESEIDALIQKPAAEDGFPLTEAEVGQIKQLAGSLPFFVQATAAYWLRCRKSEYVPDPEQARQILVGELSPYFEQWWRSFDNGYREVLRCVADNLDLAILPYSPVEVQEAIRILGNYGMVVQENGRLAINGAIFALWVQQYAQLAEQRQTLHVPNNGQHEWPAPPTDPAKLRLVLTDYFSLEDLRALCFDLGLDIEDFPGTSKQAKAIGLIEYWRNRHELGRLVQAIRQERGAIV
ncbi:MAG: ATP-binding protein [Chloroflexi bacterium]|nr:ATP-binding protein [Chloroflexota bacterium]